MPKKTKSMFVDQANVIHNYRYTYENTVYIDRKTKVEITCKIHGPFFQLPSNHISNKQGCKECSNIARWDKRGRLTYIKFIEKLPNKHKEKYTYPEQLIDSSEAIIQIVCPIHGEFTQKVISHIHGSGCRECAGNTTKTKETFVKDSNHVHNFLYDYSKFIYQSSKDKGIIICSIHGEFEQTPDSHINGKAGCNYCGSGGTYNKVYFEKYPEQCDKPSTFYFLQFEKDEEKFVKVGITITDLQKRFQPLSRNKGYEVTQLLVKELPLQKAWELEQDVLSIFKGSSYSPLEHFAGHTECIVHTEKDRVLAYINEAAILKNLM